MTTVEGQQGKHVEQAHEDVHVPEEPQDSRPSVVMSEPATHLADADDRGGSFVGGRIRVGAGFVPLTDSNGKAMEYRPGVTANFDASGPELMASVLFNGF